MTYSKLNLDLSKYQLENSSEIIIGKDVLAESADILATWIDSDTHLHIVSDTTVSELYLNRLKAVLHRNFSNISQTILPCGEHTKSPETLQMLWSDFAQNELTRNSCVIAFGGGVVSDTAGFAASTYLRGIRYVTMPTTLLSMVDASVGGKTAINLASGKNQAGTFWQPSFVIADTSLLQTLSAQDIEEGFAEVIKCAVMADKTLFSQLLNHAPLGSDLAVHEKNLDWLTNIVITCVNIKKTLVEQDPFDTHGVRIRLNLGHTFGHAIEAASNYTLPHGHSVAAGLCMMGRISQKKGWCSKETADAIENCVRAYNLPTESPYQSEELLAYIKRDKKRTDHALNIIVPKSIGTSSVMPVSFETLSDLIKLA